MRKGLIKVVLLDIDGVLTDGHVYTDGKGNEFKSLNLKDLDAITSIREEGIIVGCVSGEDTAFSQGIKTYVDFAVLGCKGKDTFIKKYCTENAFKLQDIVYVGDGKYDAEALKIVGVAVCPADAIRSVRNIADWVLTTNGGCGCIAELYDNYEHIQEIHRKKWRG